MSNSWVEAATPVRSVGIMPWTLWRSIASSITSAGEEGLAIVPATSRIPTPRVSAMRISRTARS
eukprot:532588-Prymnesium_polylepis.1